MAAEEHLRLSHYIKSVHESLRCNSRSLGWKQAWIEHCSKKEVLEEYAAAMHKLATEFWEGGAESIVNSRLEWVVKQCQWYFFEDGLQKINNQDLVKVSGIKEAGTPNSTADCCKLHFKKPLLLLDVGSCYNPLKMFPIFCTVAIDLAPATCDVFQCDFLELSVTHRVTDHQKFASESCPFFCQQIKPEMPAETFDVVNFSLFLEYLPSPQLRFECCSKAFNLLKPGGLLFIITPDSKHASANAPLMRRWRIALGTIGFVRISYQKLTHLHCMAFRKCPYPILREKLGERFRTYAKATPSEMITIPQDTSVQCDKVSCTSTESSGSLGCADVNFFSELPLSY